MLTYPVFCRATRVVLRCTADLSASCMHEFADHGIAINSNAIVSCILVQYAAGSPNYPTVRLLLLRDRRLSRVRRRVRVTLQPRLVRARVCQGTARMPVISILRPPVSREVANLTNVDLTCTFYLVCGC